jgi:hypothetical protein
MAAEAAKPSGAFGAHRSVNDLEASVAHPNAQFAWRSPKEIRPG